MYAKFHDPLLVQLRDDGCRNTRDRIGESEIECAIRPYCDTDFQVTRAAKVRMKPSVSRALTGLGEGPCAPGLEHVVSRQVEAQCTQP